jgi:hypothetical protein
MQAGSGPKNTSTWRLRPRSGDNPGTNTLGTFNALFPIGNYFGVIADTGPGPLNFIDVHPRVLTQWNHGVTVSTDWTECIPFQDP